MPHAPIARALLPLLAALAAQLPAQCYAQWEYGDPLTWARGEAAAMTMFDPDGAGPAPTRLVVGGSLSAGAALGTGVVTHDGTEWLPAGTGAPEGHVVAFTTYLGQLVAARWQQASSTATVASWNGGNWQLLGTFAGSVSAMAVYGGALYVTGFFNSVDGQPLSRIARWNGSTWSGVGSGLQGWGTALAVWNNTLHVAGQFFSAGGVPCTNYGIWNGSGWQAGPAVTGGVNLLVPRIGLGPSTSWLHAAGDFTSIGGVAATDIARLNAGTNQWTAMPGLPGSSCRALLVRSAGASSFELVAAVEASTTQKVFRWNGSGWLPLGALVSAQLRPTCLAYHQGQYVVGYAAIAPAACVERFDGASWDQLNGHGIDRAVHAIAHRQGEVVIGGAFTQVADIPASRVARKVGSTWSALGAGVDGTVHALAHLPNGDLLAAGAFATAGGMPAANIARWDGAAWHALGAGVGGPVHAMVVLANGDVIVGGAFPTAGGLAASHVARWNGSWSSLGQGALNGFNLPVLALAVLPDGSVAASGEFTAVGTGGPTVNRVARWTGSAWQPLGSGLVATSRALAVMPDGALLAAEDSVSRLQRWNGTAWNSITFAPPNAIVRSLRALPNGDLLVGGDAFTIYAGPTFQYQTPLLRYPSNQPNAQPWPQQLRGPKVHAIVQAADGDLLLGGDFVTIPGEIPHYARQNLPCPATAVPVGAGCTIPTGPLTLAPVDLPWLGATCRNVAQTIPATSLALDLVGVTPLAVPLGALLPVGGPCELRVDPLQSTVLLATNGLVTTTLPIPNVVTLVGTVLHQQVLELAFDTTGLTRLAATNALMLTLQSL